MDKVNIKIKNKKFSLFLHEQGILKRISVLAKKIKKEYKDKNPIFMVVLNGSFMFAADLLKHIDFPCEISFMRAKSYKGTKSTGQVEFMFTHKHEFESGREIIIVEDIVETGITIAAIKKHFKKINCKTSVVTLLWKPSKSGDYKPDYVAFEIPNGFVLGYGLDFDEEGRNLRHIYMEKK
jgi:hypoxanthine phosphoribosyltransferase